MTQHAPESNKAASDRASMRHFVNVGVLVVIVTVVISLLLRNEWLLPAQASAQAKIIDDLFSLHFKVIAFLFALIVVFMGYSIVVFRRKPGETEDGDHFEGHTGLEIAWTLLPLGIVLYFAYLGAQSLADTRRTDPSAMEIKVLASQWAWAFEYVEGDVTLTSTDLHLPVNRQALLKLTSADVIHSFWVPEFRVKQDALPGTDLVKELRVTPTLVGTYKVRCAELCGTRHAYMESLVIVEEPSVFNAWIQQELEKANNPVERGKRVAVKFGCIGCHSVDGSTLVGPSWQGLYGKTETFSDESTGAADDAYLLESITKPGAKVVKGFNDGIMPQVFGQTMKPEEITDVIEYIKSLK